MALDLAKIQIEPFGCVATSIGELCVFSITWGSQKEFRKALDKPINECDPTEFARKYVRYICFPKASLKEGKYKPDRPVLTDNEISSLTDDDLEKIAELYIVNNPYLSKELITKTKENDKGGTIIYHEYGDVEYPKNENETYIQYLWRLYIKKDEKLSKLVGKTLSSTIGLKSFSKELGEGIKHTLSLGDSLRNTMQSITPVSKIESPKFDLLEMARLEEEIRLRPFNNISDRLDILIDASALATEFMTKANEIQTGIAEEIKSSGDETKKFSQKNIFLTFVVIFLATFGIAVSVYTIWQSNRDANIRRIETRENINLLVGNLNKINSSILANEKSKIENQRLKAQVEQQEKDIDEMKKIILDNYDNKLYKLKKK